MHATKPERGVEGWFEAWRTALEPLHAQYGHTFKICLFEAPKEGQRFHDRFILTDQCGISVPAGLGIVSGSSTDWHLMDYEVVNSRRADFESSVHPYLKHISPSPLAVP